MTRTVAPECPECKKNKILAKFHSTDKMKRVYVRVNTSKFRKFQAIGYYCIRHDLFISDEVLSKTKEKELKNKKVINLMVNNGED